MYSLGEYVKIIDKNIEGVITGISSNKVTILANNKSVITTIDKIEIKEKPKVEPKFEVSVQISSAPEEEIMLRHLTVEEAIFRLEKFIDNAVCNNVKIVKIIHGKQGGRIRHAVHEYLESCPYVKEHRLGGYYEGSYGVTIAFLK